MCLDPPVMLVKTWIYLVTSGETKELRERGLQMLIGAFGTMENVLCFCREHHIDF